MHIRRILVAVDLSAGALATGRFAFDLATRLQASLSFVHVDEVGAPDEEEASEELRDYVRLAGSARDAQINRLKEAFADLGADAEPDLAVIDGVAVEYGITEYALEVGADVILLARRSRHSLGDRLLGSTTSHVLRLSPVPVLVVPEGVESLVTKPDCALGPIVAATDLHHTSLRAVAASQTLAEALATKLLAVHVLDWPSAADLMVSAPPDLMTRVARRMKLRAIDELNAKVRPLGIPQDQQRVISGASPAEALANLAADVGASLVTVAATGKGALKRILLGSTSERLVKLSPRPVLVMPAEWLDPSAG